MAETTPPTPEPRVAASAQIGVDSCVSEEDQRSEGRSWIGRIWERLPPAGKIALINDWNLESRFREYRQYLADNGIASTCSVPLTRGQRRVAHHAGQSLLLLGRHHGRPPQLVVASSVVPHEPDYTDRSHLSG